MLDGLSAKLTSDIKYEKNRHPETDRIRMTDILTVTILCICLPLKIMHFYRVAQFVQEVAALLLTRVNLCVNAKNIAQIVGLMTTTEIIAHMSSAAEFANNRVIFQDRQNVDYSSLSRMISFLSLEKTTLYQISSHRISKSSDRRFPQLNMLSSM